jgi:hypothetical protein
MVADERTFLNARLFKLSSELLFLSNSIEKQLYLNSVPLYGESNVKRYLTTKYLKIKRIKKKTC